LGDGRKKPTLPAGGAAGTPTMLEKRFVQPAVSGRAQNSRSSPGSGNPSTATEQSNIRTCPQGLQELTLPCPYRPIP